MTTPTPESGGSADGAGLRSGLLVVDKPGGITSFGVVARVRRLTGIKKVGHAGTLDPMATGVLVLGVGRAATRVLGQLMLTEKRYEATVRLGELTTTDDAEGEIIASTDVPVDIRAAFAGQVGEIMQVPTQFSAIKVDGKRAYDLARAGEQVELKARPVTVHSIEVREVRGHDVDISVHCSSGTYIRAIARDLGGHLTALRRTAVGPYDLDQARTLEQLGEELLLLPVPEVGGSPS